MKIYLVRHGESEAEGSDNLRTLSRQGISEIHSLAKLIAPLDIRVGHFFHSKKNRAIETANILAPFIQSKEPMEEREELDPMAPIHIMINEINQLNTDVVLVGHMPFMGALVSQLIVGNQSLDVVAFKTGTMVCLEKIEERHWIMKWMLSSDFAKHIINH